MLWLKKLFQQIRESAAVYTTVNGFLNDWNQEASLTLQVLDKLTDASLSQAVSDAQPRTLGEIAWHIVQSVGFFLNEIGLQRRSRRPKELPRRPSRRRTVGQAIPPLPNSAQSGRVRTTSWTSRSKCSASSTRPLPACSICLSAIRYITAVK